MASSPKFLVVLMVLAIFMIMAPSTGAETSSEKLEVEGMEGPLSCGGNQQSCCREIAHGVCVDFGCCQAQGPRRCCRKPGTTVITPYGQKWRNYCCMPRARCAANQIKCIWPSAEGGLREWAREMFGGETEGTPEVNIDQDGHLKRFRSTVA